MRDADDADSPSPPHCGGSRSSRRRGGGQPPAPAWRASSGGSSREVTWAKTVEKAEVFCRACRSSCPLLCQVCPTCESAPSFSVSGNFNLRGALRVLHDGRSAGASNLVLVGYERDLDRRVAVKAARLADEPEEVATLRLEIQLQRKLAHPNLVPLMYAAETPSEVLLVTPFAAGGDLNAAVPANNVLSELEARNLCSQLLEGLRYMHERHSMLHGDVKPRNILLVPAGHAHIAQLGDFGLSREVPREPPFRCDFRGLQGTHGYLAPELLAREDYGFAVDIFALGVIIFTLVGGYEPFYPASNVTAPLEFDSSCWTHISDQSAAFVTALLRTAPEERPSAAEAAEDDWLLMEPSADVAPLPPGAPKPVDLRFHPRAQVLEALAALEAG